MKITRYVCPNCERPSGKMSRRRRAYFPTPTQREHNPIFHEIGIDHEFLRCPCGRVWSWYHLRRVVTS